jgi:hypothetical protein
MKASRKRCSPALIILALPSLACAGQAAAAAPSLAACVNINDSAERLACYDKLAGRDAALTGQTPAAQAQPAVLPQPAGLQAPTVATPAAAATPGAPAPPSNATVTTNPHSAAAQGSSPPQSFGLYAAEHPKAPQVSRTLEARVIGFGASADGRTTISLDGSGLWEQLDDSDPLLKVGDTVTIRRAAFGSYLMTTPTKRTHRVRRLH